MTPLVPIRSVDELKKVLFLQRTITQAAKDEMLAIAADEHTARNIKTLLEQQSRLLENYANYPTLAEFSAIPLLTNVYKWGATFGVATLVGGLILNEVQTIQPHFAPVLRQMFVLLLKELDNPEHEYLVDPLIKALRIQVTAENGDAAEPQRREAFIRQVVHELVETFVHVCVQYGVMVLPDGKQVALTPVGKRILLHLTDTARFIDEMTKAHIKLQSVKPKLSMV